MNENTVIPEKHIEFCKAVAALAREHELDRVSLQFRPGFHDDWRDEIVMNWEQGRHGEDSNRLMITSTVMVRTKLTL